MNDIELTIEIDKILDDKLTKTVVKKEGIQAMLKKLGQDVNNNVIHEKVISKLLKIENYLTNMIELENMIE